VAAIAGFLYGYDTGIISGALLHMRQDFKLSHQRQEITASAILFGAVAGVLACGWMFERIGRRRTLMLVAAIFAVGALASSIAPSAVLLGGSSLDNVWSWRCCRHRAGSGSPREHVLSSREAHAGWWAKRKWMKLGSTWNGFALRALT
jgi:MFS family permease